MVCEHPDWGFIECYREVTGIEYRLLQRLCEKHTTKIMVQELTEPKYKELEKPISKQIKDSV